MAIVRILKDVRVSKERISGALMANMDSFGSRGVGRGLFLDPATREFYPHTLGMGLHRGCAHPLLVLDFGSLAGDLIFRLCSAQEVDMEINLSIIDYLINGTDYINRCFSVDGIIYKIVITT